MIVSRSYARRAQDDVALSAEVESLLDAHARAGDRGMASPFDALDSSAISSLAQVLKSGECLGPYEILTPLGAGGMGEVYKARDTRLDRTVAIKVLSARTSAMPPARERFTGGAAIAALNHPHICTLHDVGCCAVPRRPEPIDFLVMEYLEGETLATRLAKGALPLDHALENRDSNRGSAGRRRIAPASCIAT